GSLLQLGEANGWRHALRSGDVDLDFVCRMLRRGPELSRPPAKVLELISCLVRHRDRVLPKEEIAKIIWPEVTVSESSLRWLLKEVRRFLGDSGSSQRYIETVRGYGLRWVADVSVLVS